MTSPTPRNPGLPATRILPDGRILPERDQAAIEDIERRIVPIINAAEEFTAIASNRECTIVGDLIVTIKTLQGEVDLEYDETINLWHVGHKGELARKAVRKEPLVDAERRLKALVGNWLDRQELQAEIEDTRADALAEAEARRLQKEEADTLRSIGAFAAADRVLAAPPAAFYTAPVILPSNRPRMPGVNRRETWSYEITDMMTLVRAVACGRAPIQCLIGNDDFLIPQARSCKQHLNYPGVKAVKTKGLAAGKKPR